MSDVPSSEMFLLDLDGEDPAEAFARIVDEAARLMASDIFLASDEGRVTVALRHLGIVRPLSSLPADQGVRLIRHVKAEAGIDIAQPRKPLDGRWIYEREGSSKVDLRISCIPTLYGEDMAIRLLDRETQALGLDDLGLTRTQLNHVLSGLSNPSGLILVTGPTGAGKTTTLYACLEHLNDGRRKINTIEDPIEYPIKSIRQSQVNLSFGVDFPDLLRAILRQGPDVIMIGEVRDQVTAETAVRAANSGHLVFATLHAPIAAGAIQSLLALGVHPHFLSTSLLCVVSQRLVRTLCPKCKTEVDLSIAPDTFKEIERWLEPGEGEKMYAAGRCAECRQEGYTARTGAFEVMMLTKDLRKMVNEACSAGDIHQKAVEHGMLEFRQSALLKVAKGITTIEEVFRAVPTQYLGLES